MVAQIERRLDRGEVPHVIYSLDALLTSHVGGKGMVLDPFWSSDWLTGKDSSYKPEYRSELEYILSC